MILADGIAEGFAKAMLWLLLGLGVAIVALVVVATVVGLGLSGIVYAVRRRLGWSPDESAATEEPPQDPS